MHETKRTTLLITITIIGLALNLRPALATIGPLLDLIDKSIGLTATQAGLLTTLPVFAMGLFAFAGHSLRQLFSERTGIGIGIFVIALSNSFRLFSGSTASLIATAILAGIGIALTQALLPSLIKRIFHIRAGRIMGLYTTGIMAGAAIAAASAADLAEFLGWQATLACWTLPAVFALLLWFSVIPREAPASVTLSSDSSSFWRKLRAWELMIFFGVGTGAYTLVLAWLPPFYVELGWSRVNAGYLLGILTIAEVIGGLGISAVIGNFPDRRMPILFALALLATGLVCLIAAPLPLALPACILMGLGIGSLFPLSLVLTLDHLDDPKRAGELAAFVQGGGYIIASAMPLLAGLLRDKFSDLSQAWIVMFAGTVLLMGMSLRFSSVSYEAFGNPSRAA